LVAPTDGCVVPKRVFISYRREDTAPAAGRVYDRLCRLISKPNVFFDVSTISGGEIYDRKIMSEIERSEAVLVFIGKSWFMSNGRMRLQEPDDYVRAEVRAALGRPILVLPVLVDGAQMPPPDQLPDDIRALSTRNALSLRHESFDDDTENIVAAVLGVAEGARPWDDRGRLAVKVGYAAAGLIVVSTVLMVAALAHFWLVDRPLSASIGEAATTFLLLGAAVIGVGLGLGYERHRRKRRHS
jgi:TIR domain-containing protein